MSGILVSDELNVAMCVEFDVTKLVKGETGEAATDNVTAGCKQ